MKKILPLLVVGILVLSGLGAVAVTNDTLIDNQMPDETLLSQKQGSQVSESREILLYAWIKVHVKEIYGTVENPKYRALDNVTVEIKRSLYGIMWLFYWNGTTNESGGTITETDPGLFHKVKVSKEGYHTYKCLPFTILLIAEMGVYDVYFTMAEDGSPFVQQISQNNQKQLKQPQLDEVESVLQNKEMDSLLSLYGLDTEDTMGEFEQVLYNSASKRRWIYPSLAAKLMNDIDELSDILEQIGVTDHMTIAEALPIIENNKEQLQEKGINLFCSIDIYLIGGGCLPFLRLYKALYGYWKVLFDCSSNHVTIYNPIIGLQRCEGKECKESYYGNFIGLIGFNPPVIAYLVDTASQHTWIRGDFTLFSLCNVPFVNSSGSFQQSPCPCNQQGNLQNNNMQSTGQQSFIQSSQSVVNVAPSTGKIDVATSRTTFNDGTLSGYVNNTSMNPIEGALVRVYFHGTYEENYTDSSGYYNVTNIPICYCMKNCTASKEGYKTEWVLLSIDENTTHDFTLMVNQPPSAPDIEGPTVKPVSRPLPKVGEPWNYTFKSTDPDEDDVYYWIEWDDGDFEDWFGPFESGEEVTRSHTWSEKGTYIVMAKAKDIYGAESEWGTLDIIMPKNHNMWFLRWLERFPILQMILDVLRLNN